MTQFRAQHEPLQLASYDGTKLLTRAYGPEGGPTMVLVPGLATPPLSYRPMIERFSNTWRIITWDMRGTFGSGTPARGVRAYRVQDHVSDLEVIVGHYGLSTFVLGGWSMAVQISLQYYVENQDQVSGLFLLSGGYGRILSHSTLAPLPRPLWHLLGALGPHLSPVINPGMRWLLGRPLLLKVLEKARVISCRSPHFDSVIRAFRGVDFGVYLSRMLHLDAHSAQPTLSYVRVPTFICAGTLDKMTPLVDSRAMAEQIPNAVLVEIEGGTHYTPLEHPEELHDALSIFLGGLLHQRGTQ